MRQVCMANKPIRISEEVLRKLKCERDKKQLRSYDAVLKKLLKKEGKI